MNLLISVESHFYRTPDGSVYTKSIENYKFWKRYLEVFEELTVLARVKDVIEKDNKWLISSGDNVRFVALPDYVGPKQFVMHMHEINKLISETITQVDCAILRGPGVVGTIVWRQIRKTKKVYGLEVVGDPWESLAPGTVKNIARPLARLYFTQALKKQCIEANAVSYVTEKTLQKRYPSKNRSNSYGISDVTLEVEHLESNSSSGELDRNQTSNKESLNSYKDSNITIINVGSMTTLYKAQDIQIKAINECLKRGYNVKLILVGDGVYRKVFENLAKNLKIEDRINFTGMLAGVNEVTKELDKADIFILPSTTEGLPRALIEAMSRKLPCIASNVGGIPELLPEECLVKPGDYIGLANKIIELISNPDEMEKYRRKNSEKSKEFSSDILEKRRVHFYTKLKKMSI